MTSELQTYLEEVRERVEQLTFHLSHLLPDHQKKVNVVISTDIPRLLAIANFAYDYALEMEDTEALDALNKIAKGEE